MLKMKWIKSDVNGKIGNYPIYRSRIYISRISVYMHIREGVISFLITYSERYLDQYSSEARVRHGTFRGNVTALGRVEA